MERKRRRSEGTRHAVGCSSLGKNDVAAASNPALGPNDGLAPVKGGCAAVPGLEVAAALALAAMLRRRR